MLQIVWYTAEKISCITSIDSPFTAYTIATNVKLGLVETRLAIIPGAGGTQRLTRIVGIAQAKRLIFSAKILNGQEAAKIGLVEELVEQNTEGDAAYHAAVAFAEEILPQVIQNDRVVLN